MAMRLVDDDLEISLELPISEGAREALSIQMQRGFYSDTRLSFEARLVERLSDLIDSDLRPPTASQVSYAISISRSLDVALPSEALRFKGAMNDFLGRYAPIFKERQATNGRKQNA